MTTVDSIGARLEDQPRSDEMQVSDIAIWVCFLSALAGSTVRAQQDTPVEAPAYEQAVEDQLATVPLTGSQLAPDANRCSLCHTEPALWDENNRRLFIQPELLEHDVH